MGLPIYAEQGRNGGYKVLTNRVIPPILFTEEEAVSLFCLSIFKLLQRLAF